MERDRQMNDITTGAISVLTKELDQTKQEIAQMSGGMLKAMMALDARIDELEEAIIVISRKVNMSAPVRKGEAAEGKEL